MQIPKEWLRYAAQDAANTYDIYCTLLAEIAKIDNKAKHTQPVSYTHLTLPTTPYV